MSEDQIRRIIQEELKKQLTPMTETLARLINGVGVIAAHGGCSR